MIKLNVNGKDHELDISSDTPLLWAIRDHLQLTGTKFGCGVSECGACTVLMDGVATRSCVTPVKKATGKKIVTLEGLPAKVSDSLFKAWTLEEVPQCGYCQPGQIMSAAALLAENPQPKDPEIDEAMSGNICRCGTYPRIRRAIHRAATLMAERGKQ